jgi:hypothetical protein
LHCIFTLLLSLGAISFFLNGEGYVRMYVRTGCSNQKKNNKEEGRATTGNKSTLLRGDLPPQHDTGSEQFTEHDFLLRSVHNKLFFSGLAEIGGNTISGGYGTGIVSG